MYWMDGKLFVLIIIFMVIVVPSIFKVAREYLHNSAEQRARHLEEETAKSNAEMLQRLSTLEERVRVLERIVTDERYDLERRFRELGS